MIMTVTKILDENKLTLFVDGKLDTKDSPKPLDEFNESSAGVDEVVIDLAKDNYMSSSGLRVLLTAQKAMSKRGKLSIVNVTPDMMEVFELTRFTNILNIQ